MATLIKWFKANAHSVLGIVFLSLMIGAIILVREERFILASLGIGSFLLSLVCMDYMTYNARKRLKQINDRNCELIKKEREGKILDEEKEELDRLKNDIKELPLADRIALIFPEPIKVLDRHEIRRSLVISLTIVFIILLFKESPMMEHFIWVYFSVITFYFGSRCLEKYAETRKAAEEAKIKREK